MNRSDYIVGKTRPKAKRQKMLMGKFEIGSVFRLRRDMDFKTKKGSLYVLREGKEDFEMVGLFSGEVVGIKGWPALEDGAPNVKGARTVFYRLLKFEGLMKDE